MNHPPLHNAVLLQVFVAVTSLTGLILAAVINEREHIGEAFESEKRLLSASEAAKERLEERVSERTQELEQKAAQLEYQAKLLDQAKQTLTIQQNGEKRIDWRIQAPQIGKLSLLATAKTT